jgi:hypothetical protein
MPKWPLGVCQTCSDEIDMRSEHVCRNRPQGPHSVEYDDFALPNGKWDLPAGERAPQRTVLIWTTGGQQWGCLDGKKGCPRCHRLDTADASLLSNQIEGVMEVWSEAGRWLVWLNATGRARVETALRRGGFSEGLDA